MTKPKTKVKSPIVYPNRYSFSNQQKNRILDLMGYDAEEFDEDYLQGCPIEEKEEIKSKIGQANQAMINIEYWVGAHKGGLAQAIDAPPGPGDYKAAFTGLSRTAHKLLEEAINLDYWMREALQLNGYDLSTDLYECLGKLMTVSQVIINSHGTGDGRGRKKGAALKGLINQLRWNFQKFYNEADQCNEKTGARKTDKEKTEEECIKFILNSADINFGKNIRRYYISPGEQVTMAAQF